MAITSVKSIYDGKSQKEGRHYTYERRFLAISNTTTDTDHIARNAEGIPRMGDEHPENLLARVDDLFAGPLNSRDARVFLVTAHYSSRAPAVELPDDPLALPPDIVWGSAMTTEEYEMDTNGDVPFSSAGDKYDPPPSREISRPTLTITRNQAAFDAAVKLEYENHINSSMFYGAPEYTAKIASITARRMNQGVAYWQVTYEIHFNFRKTPSVPEFNGESIWLGWRDAFVDAGANELHIGFSDVVPIRDASGEPLGIVRLDGNGQWIGHLDAEDPNNRTHWRGIYYPYAVADFNALGL